MKQKKGQGHETNYCALWHFFPRVSPMRQKGWLHGGSFQQADLLFSTCLLPRERPGGADTTQVCCWE